MPPNCAINSAMSVFLLNDIHIFGVDGQGPEGPSAIFVEFSEELGIPKSTMQPILKTGNTTLNTAVSIASALDVSLDELIRGEDAFEQTRFITLAGQMFEKFDRLDAEEQELILHHINEIFGIVRKK